MRPGEGTAGILSVWALDAWLHRAERCGGSRVWERARPGKGSAGLVGDACGVLAWPLPAPCRGTEVERRGAEAANRAGGSARSVATWRGKVSKRGRYHVGSRQQWLSGKTG